MTSNATTTTARPMRVTAYYRVSTAEQGDSGLGLEAQRAAVAAECARRGWELVAEHQDIASAKTTNGRPELAAALAELDAGDADALVAAKLDRLSRSTLDGAKILARAKRRGWAVVVLDIGLDTTAAAGELMVSVMLAVAQYEREATAARTRAALAAKRAQGYRLGRPVALPQAVRARIAAERAAGATLRAIGAGLEADGIATAQGGARWYPATVSAVLASVALDTAAA
jgi:DNA invertase Pin-like site-specific DNA recombinase